MRKVLILTASLLALAACRQPAEPVVVDPGPPPPLTAARAFEMAFGDAAPVERKVTREGVDYQETLTYRPAKLVPMSEGHVALVSLATNASDCHACSGAMAIHYLRRTGTTWTLEGGWPEIVGGNGFGAPPDWTVRTDLGEPLYIVAEAGWSGQGYTCSSADLIELMPGAPRVLGQDIPIHYDNEGVGTPPVVNIVGTLGRGPDGKLRVTFTGSKTGFTDYQIVGPALVRTSPNLIDDC
jgi:hypothetical protein